MMKSGNKYSLNNGELFGNSIVSFYMSFHRPVYLFIEDSYPSIDIARVNQISLYDQLLNQSDHSGLSDLQLKLSEFLNLTEDKGIENLPFYSNNPALDLTTEKEAEYAVNSLLAFLDWINEPKIIPSDKIEAESINPSFSFVYKEYAFPDKNTDSLQYKVLSKPGNTWGNLEYSPFRKQWFFDIEIGGISLLIEGIVTCEDISSHQEFHLWILNLIDWISQTYRKGE